MKIGILTFHRAKNYGAVLQAYALQQTLINKGIKCDIIDYINSKIENDYKIIQTKKGKKALLKSIIKVNKSLKLSKVFKDFSKKYFYLSKEYNKENINQVNNLYDAFITGSDQVFNSTCAAFDANYFLEFCDDLKRYSYAASFGDEKIKKNLDSEYVRRFSKFKYISCREEDGKKYINSIMNKDIFVHIDPVFLLDSKEWEKMIVPIKYKKYIFIYKVGEPINLFEYAINLARRENCEIVFLDQYMNKPLKGMNNLHVASPEEFITLIANAEYVVTNSFHGVALSIIFNKKFYVELDRTTGKNKRVSNLMNKVGIFGNEIVNSNINEEKFNINWDEVNEKISNEIKISKEYLERIVTNNN